MRKLMHRATTHLNEAEKARLDEVVRQTGLTVSEILRLLIRQASVAKYPVRARKLPRKALHAPE